MTRPLSVAVILALAMPAAAFARSPRLAARPQPASRPAPALRPATAPATTMPATLPAMAWLTLDQIEPRPVMPKPVTRPAGSAPTDALVLYARARDAMLDGDRTGATNLLEQAVNADGQSAELYLALAQMYAAGSANDKALSAMAKAVALQPDDLEMQLQVAQQYVMARNPAKAMEHLRLARLTSDYKAFASEAALVELRLAQVLKNLGYIRAAAGQYEAVLGRLERPVHVLRGNFELQRAYARIGSLYLDLGDMQRALGNGDAAVQAYVAGAARSEGDLGLSARLIRATFDSGARDQAHALTLAFVARSHAAPEAVDLLRDELRASNREGELIGDLKKLLAANPRDRRLVLGLADALTSAGRGAEASDLLEEALKRGQVDDLDLVRRAVELNLSRDDTQRAARVLVEYSAVCPTNLDALRPLWNKLATPGQKNRLRLAAIEKIKVAPAADGAKLFWLAVNAELWGRDGAARNYLAEAAKLRPAFAPAYRALLTAALTRPDYTDQQRDAALTKLIDSAGSDPALAAELRGVWLGTQKKYDQAITALEESIRLGRPGPQVQISLAVALIDTGKDDRATSILWKVVSDYPSFDEGYLTLFRYYLSHNTAQQAIKVLRTWIDADPRSVTGRLVAAGVYMQVGQLEEAKTIVLPLFAEEPQNLEVVMALQRYYAQSNQRDQFMKDLEREQHDHPYNRAVLECLIATYSTQHRDGDAFRAIEDMHKAVADDPDLLYYTAHLYERIDRKARTEEVLGEVLKLEPHHPAASNDLGYMWADDGRNLPQAEGMIRDASKSEPENVAFLDSMGWVLYKQGKFAEAQRYLQQAIGRAAAPDPVMLDHLGDTLYRLDQADEALKHWNQSLETVKKIENPRTELRDLRQQLEEKIRQQTAGEKVKVAPATQPAEGNQAHRDP